MWHINFKLLGCVFSFILLVILSGCATVSSHPLDRNKMFYLAEQEGFKKIHLSASPFILTAYHKLKAPSEILVVYIEGDGYAWASRTRPSDDPTPKHPLAFFLASEDGSSNVLYLARPGQFLDAQSPRVNQAYWTFKRYSQEVIHAMNAAIDEVKASTGSSKVSLVGYSGGAAVAVLIAARRDDVASLRTVAGNLASNKFVQMHHLSSLSGSLDPVSVAQIVKSIPQRHFIGMQDTVVSNQIVETFLDAEGDSLKESLTEVKDVDHLNGWVERWKGLLDKPLNRI